MVFKKCGIFLPNVFCISVELSNLLYFVFSIRCFDFPVFFANFRFHFAVFLPFICRKDRQDAMDAVLNGHVSLGDELNAPIV